MSETTAAIDVDALLNANIADVEDLPDLVTLPAGQYVLRGVSAKLGETQKNKPKLGFLFALEEVVELDNTEDEAPETGSNTYYAFAGDQFAARVKKAFGATMVENNINTIAELVDQFDNLTFLVQTKTRKDKDDPNVVYGDMVLAVIQ